MANDLMAAPRFAIAAEGMRDLPAMILFALKQFGGSAAIEELDARVIENANLSEEEQSHLMPNDQRRRVNYSLAWSRTYLRIGGAIVNSKRGVWALTEKGEAVRSLAGTQAIYKEVQKARGKNRASGGAAADMQVPGKSAAGLDEQDGEEDWRAQLLAVLGAMEPAALEGLWQRRLREAGFIKVEVRGKSGDGGIDGVGVLRVNLVSFQIYFQCKRWASTVGAKEIRDFRGALQGRADKGLFITTSSFTAQAQEEAVRDGAIAIDLIDGQRLCDLLKQFELGVATRFVEQVEIAPAWFAEV